VFSAPSSRSQNLWELGREEETPGRELAPPFDGRLSRSTVEGRVYLYRREVIGVLDEPAGRRGSRRIHRPLPVSEGLARGAQVQALLGWGYLPGIFLEEFFLLMIFYSTRPGC
jgi:hypothetical protein